MMRMVHVRAVYHFRYEFPVELLFPQKKECTNLINPVSPSTTHVSLATVRMEPQFMILGQSAGVIAAITAMKNEALPSTPAAVATPQAAVQDVDLAVMHRLLLAGNQTLTMGSPLPPPPPKPPSQTSYGCVVGYCIQLGVGGGDGKDSSVCGGALCAGHTLNKLQWLALPKHFTKPKPIYQRAGASPLFSITAVINTHIKKSEVNSELLNSTMAVPVPANSSLTLTAMPAPGFGIYEMISCSDIAGI